MYRTSTYPHLLRKFSDGDMTVLHAQVRTWSMSSSFRLVEGLPERASLATDVWPYESVVPLLNLCDAHGIVAENPLNLPNGFHLATAKLLAKFDAIPLLESFRHFRRK